MSELTFSKIVVSKHSPKNACLAPDGAVLIVEPLQNVPQKTIVQHQFVAMGQKKPTSKYGWVKEVPIFTLQQFIEANLGKRELSDQQREHLTVMLTSIQNLPTGTAVTTDYKRRGVIERTMQITVHKVMFYLG